LHGKNESTTSVKFGSFAGASNATELSASGGLPPGTGKKGNGKKGNGRKGNGKNGNGKNGNQI